ncbi:hypothetical protein ACFV6G_04630 [Streptomyces lavendulae]|uniref:hypothetical protein n=1 Tax=Streptomyces lavendulae TaxID=1914 RepID=UPI00367D77AC
MPRSRVVDITALVRAGGTEVDLRLDPVPDGRPEAVEQAAYRTVQEALTNVRQHAPGAPARVRVGLVAQGAGLRVEVSNPPVESAAATLPGGGRGLTGLRASGPTTSAANSARVPHPTAASWCWPPSPCGRRPPT